MPRGINLNTQNSEVHFSAQSCINADTLPAVLWFLGGGERTSKITFLREDLLLQPSVFVFWVSFFPWLRQWCILASCFCSSLSAFRHAMPTRMFSFRGSLIWYRIYSRLLHGSSLARQGLSNCNFWEMLIRCFHELQWIFESGIFLCVSCCATKFRWSFHPSKRCIMALWPSASLGFLPVTPNSLWQEGGEGMDCLTDEGLLQRKRMKRSSLPQKAERLLPVGKRI